MNKKQIQKGSKGQKENATMCSDSLFFYPFTKQVFSAESFHALAYLWRNKDGKASNREEDSRIGALNYSFQRLLVKFGSV